MLWGLKRYGLLGKDDEEWQLDCWAWLIENLGGIEAFRETPLIVPTTEFFRRPTNEDEPAEHYFSEIVRLTGMGDWPFELVRQDNPIDPKLGPLAVVQNIRNDPAGTFRMDSHNEILISYSPDLVDRPEDLVTTFVHEISHAVVLSIGAEPPGGWNCEEFATDLTVAFLGFGVFGANSAFRFSQFTDNATGSQGWSYRRSGYLTQPEWCFALAVFLILTDQDPGTALRFLNDGPAASLRKSLKYLKKHPECIEEIRGQLDRRQDPAG